MIAANSNKRRGAADFEKKPTNGASNPLIILEQLINFPNSKASLLGKRSH